jgi:hypothetical protein
MTSVRLEGGSYWWNAIGNLTAAEIPLGLLNGQSEFRNVEAARRALFVLMDQFAKKATWMQNANNKVLFAEIGDNTFPRNADLQVI